MRSNEIDQLFIDTKAAFNRSKIKQYAESNNLKWFYSISSTKLAESSNLIVGFNPGAEDNYPYEPQTNIPDKNFKELLIMKDLGSMQRVYNLLKEFLPQDDIDNSVQTNFCFFRSKKASEITPCDLELSAPLFHKFVLIVKPKRIIGFSSILRNHLRNNPNFATIEPRSFPSNNKNVIVAKGTYHVNDLEIPIFLLPHPNSPINKDARRSAWSYCFGSI